MAVVRQEAGGRCQRVDRAAVRFECALVVEDDARVRQALEEALQGWAQRVLGAGGVERAKRLLSSASVGLLIVDVNLPDGSAFDLLESLAGCDVQPLVIAVSGSASVHESFELAKRGVRAFLSKPVGVDALERAINAGLGGGPDLRPWLRAAVGHRAIHDVEQEVRATMLREALARSGGSRSAAARLLSVSRQLLQHMLRAHAQAQPGDARGRSGS